MRKTLKLLVFISVALTLAACNKATEQAEIPAKDRLNPVDVQAWSDDVFGKIVAEHRVSALAIAVTQGDKVIFTKGYGYADWASKKPVDPETTQFRIASLSKTFVGTVIAQLLERGQIASLDDPVNKYLKRFQLRSDVRNDVAWHDVTIWEMLNHRGGLGPSAVFVEHEVEPRPVHPLPGEYIAERMPHIVRDPGTLSIYCNPCTATLGFMIEDITGMRLQDYLDKNIFQPLGMTHSEMTNTPTQGPNVVTQYAFVAGGPPVAEPYPVITPLLSYAGDINSTAVDMSKWLIAHIGEGKGAGAKLLKPETFKLMHARHAGNTPSMSGFGMQFFTYDYNGEHVLEHYGSLNFRSMEFFMLDKKIGVFVTFGGGGEPGRDAVQPTGETLAPVDGPVMPAMSHSGVRALVLEHFLGKLPFDKDAKADVAKYVGVYHNIPAAADAKPNGQGLKVEAAADGNALVIGGVGPYRPSGPDTFTLDGPLPLEAGFRDSNKWEFVTDGPAMRMFEHINAGGLERDAAQ